MSYDENRAMGNSTSSSTNFKTGPREDQDTLNASASPSRVASNTLLNIRGQPTDAARVYLDRGLPVPSYILNQLAASSSALNSTTNKNTDVLPRNEDIAMNAPATQPIPPESAPVLYTVYNTVSDISYNPEEALKQGLGMTKSIKQSIKKLQLGSKLRQEVWMRDILNLEVQGAPTTLIAVCGATGAGKSSILNAILDDNIVPTSGMRACTAVVTELAYHNKSTIDADVSFLSETEWRQELEVLLQDLVDEEGNLKRSTDLKSDAGVAWSKVNAVYPAITQKKLIKMTVDQILMQDAKILGILGSTKNIAAKDSKTFAKEISKYIDSKDEKRGDKKGKKKIKNKEKSLMDKVRDAADTSSRSKDKDNRQDPDAPALWPLIRQVNVRCPAAALSTGAVLVDLPGVVDANVARNNIAKDYMKKCDCIWILAPITRAVDDKTARDLLGDAFKMQLMNGNYDDHAISFIASKTDDISCSEVIRALNLEDDPELEAIEERLETASEKTSAWKKKKSTTDKLIKGIEFELKGVYKYLREYKAHLDALKNGKSFTPTLTAHSNKKDSKMRGKKRKISGKAKKGSPKRRRSSPGLSDDDDDFVDSDDSSASDEDNGSENDSDEDPDEDSGSESSSATESDGDVIENEESEVTEEILEEKIKATKTSIKSLRETLSDARKQKKEAIDSLSTLAKTIAKAQKEKNAFCSIKRSEFSRDVLKEDFRVGLKDLDDAAAEERNPDTFNPNVNIRDYDSIDLPVFTCSSRDYVRLKRQVKGDGEPSCFSNIKDTGIPEVQQWCHQLTISSRERAAKNFLACLKTFATSIQSYVQGTGDVTAADRESLRQQWESSGLEQDGDNEDDDPYGFRFPSNLFDAILRELHGGPRAGRYTLQKPAPKVDAYGQLVGITPHLCKEFGKMVDNSVEELQQLFRNGLEDKCKVGAANAANAATPTAEEFANSMHWGTYRATLRRHGSWRRDLNVELVTPFTRNIAHSWSKVFESDLFASFEAAAMFIINKLLKDVEDSAAPGLKDRAKLQGELCLEEAHVALIKSMEVVRETMNNEQKEVSRCIAPHVQAQLVEGYDRAIEERGKGSVTRQKTYFRGFIQQCKDDIFDDGADVVMNRLTDAAQAVGKALNDALAQLAQKIEVSLAVLWEGTRDDPTQIRARQEVIDVVTNVQRQIYYWTQAREARVQIPVDADVVMN